MRKYFVLFLKINVLQPYFKKKLTDALSKHNLFCFGNGKNGLMLYLMTIHVERRVANPKINLLKNHTAFDIY